MGAEHAVGRAPTGAQAHVGAPVSPPSGPTVWPRLDTGHPAAAQPAVPAAMTSAAPTPSGAVPLVARRRPRLPRSVLLVVLGVVLVVVCALVLGTRAGALLLALLLLVCAVARAVLPAPGPSALAVRSRTLDVLTLAGFGLVLGALALVLPGR